jgi:hypothetical protein
LAVPLPAGKAPAANFASSNLSRKPSTSAKILRHFRRRLAGQPRRAQQRLGFLGLAVERQGEGKVAEHARVVGRQGHGSAELDLGLLLLATGGKCGAQGRVEAPIRGFRTSARRSSRSAFSDWPSSRVKSPRSRVSARALALPAQVSSTAKASAPAPRSARGGARGRRGRECAEVRASRGLARTASMRTRRRRGAFERRWPGAGRQPQPDRQRAHLHLRRRAMASANRQRQHHGLRWWQARGHSERDSIAGQRVRVAAFPVIPRPAARAQGARTGARHRQFACPAHSGRCLSAFAYLSAIFTSRSGSKACWASAIPRSNTSE